MKRYLFLFISLSLFSCSSDDTETVTPEVNIVGFWKEVSVKEEGDTEFEDVTNCQTHPESNTYEFTDYDAMQVSYTCAPELSNHTLGVYYLEGDNLITHHVNPEVDDYIVKYNIVFVDTDNITITEIHNSVDGDVVNGKSSRLNKI